MRKSFSLVFFFSFPSTFCMGSNREPSQFLANCLMAQYSLLWKGYWREGCYIGGMKFPCQVGHKPWPGNSYSSHIFLAGKPNRLIGHTNFAADGQSSGEI